MQQFLVLILGPLLAVLLVIVKIPSWEAWLSSLHPKASLIISIVLVLGTVYNYVISVLSPHKKLMENKKKRWARLSEEAEKLKGEYTQFDLCMNVMIPKRCFFYFIEPKPTDPTKTKFSWTGLVFSVVWNYGTNHVKRKLKFTTNQGACGNAYTEEEINGVVLTPALVGNNNFNFTQEQIRCTSPLIMLVSCPIITKEDTASGQKLDILGVLNVESRVPGSEQLLTDPAQRAAFFTKVNNLSKSYVNLL